MGDSIKFHACTIHNLTLNKKYVGTCLTVYKLMLNNDPFTCPSGFVSFTKFLL